MPHLITSLAMFFFILTKLVIPSQAHFFDCDFCFSTKEPNALLIF